LGKRISHVGFAAGFGAVFGTPIAGAVFAMEVLAVGRVQYLALVPCLGAALLADWTCQSLGIHHVAYLTQSAPSAVGSCQLRILREVSGMRYERVHTIGEIYDGVRTGTADLNGAPHYFASQFDETEDEYSGSFKLYPVEPEFMHRALRQWVIFRTWELKFHEGKAELRPHPRHGQIDAEYDELQLWLQDQIPRLQAVSGLYMAGFRVLPGQDNLSPGILRELEVTWSQIPENAP